MRKARKPFVGQRRAADDNDSALGRDHPRHLRTEGEPYFARSRTNRAAWSRGRTRVIALGDGAVEDTRRRAVLRNAQVVYLRVSYDEAMERGKSDESAHG